MTFESILPINTPCPECGAATKPGEVRCPACGADLQKSLIEEEAALYQKELAKTKRKRSNLGMSVFILSTLLLFMVTSEVYDEYKHATAITVPRAELYITFITAVVMTTLVLGLTILCYFKPMAACIAGLCFYAFFMTFAIIGAATDDQPLIVEGEEIEFIIETILYLLFPAGLSIAIYRLKKRE